MSGMIKNLLARRFDATLNYVAGTIGAIFKDESVNVRMFPWLAKGDGVTDDTAAFAAAITTGKKVIVPWTAAGYVINNLAVVTNMVIEGEKSGVSNGPTLIVTQNNAGVFTLTTQAFQFEISNFVIRAAAGVTGARAYKQLDKSYYTAYAKFNNIETSSNLAITYDLFPIFTTWDGCRDGYIDTAGAQGHQAINAIPEAWNQGNQCNVNKIINSQWFGCNGSAMAGTSEFVANWDVGYGETWTVDNCDFEGLSIPAIRSRGIFNFNIRNSRGEGFAAPSVFISGISPVSSIGNTFYFDKAVFNLLGVTTQFISLGAASPVYLKNTMFTQIPVGIVLCVSPESINEATDIACVGAGAAGFLTGVNTTFNTASGKKLLNGAVQSGSAAAVQLAGVNQASGGFTSAFNVAVTTAFVTIAAFQLSGGLAVVNGYNTNGGNPGTWIVLYRSGGVPVVVSSSDVTATTPTFQMSGANLQMKTTAGTLAVSVANLV